MENLTPMMKQYLEIKNEYKDYLIMFRLGDFYEMFFDDAVIASKVLSITLTKRNAGGGKKAPLAGIPYHALDNYLYKLVENNYKVVIVEQVEDPKLAKGIVKREVTKIVTKGTFSDIKTLNPKTNNYILSIFFTNDKIGLSYADISTLTIKTTFLDIADRDDYISEIFRIDPSEVILIDNNIKDEKLYKLLNENYQISFEANSLKNLGICEELIKRVFNIKSLYSLGIDKDESITISSAILLHYIETTQKVELSSFSDIEIYSVNDYMIIDNNTIRNLELLESMMSKNKSSSFIHTIDKTKTAMGSRNLRKWVLNPLQSVSKLNKRMDIVEYLVNDIILLKDLENELFEIYDMERISSKILFKTVNPKDLIMLKNSIKGIINLKNILADLDTFVFDELLKEYDDLTDIYSLIEASIIDEPPIIRKDGGFIKDSFNDEIYELNSIIKNSNNLLLEIEKEEKIRTNIPTLKIGYNKVFGYYIEVTKKFKDAVPDEYIRKQTLSNAERFIYPKLKSIESKIINARDDIISLENKIFDEISVELSKNLKRIKNISNIISKIDTLVSFARVSYSNNYIRPILNEEGIIELKDSRHLVVEKLVKNEKFITNDCLLDTNDNRFIIITGPNMAGKSTYLRQVALITLMAHIGVFVPASYANISLVDKIFTRVGAYDDLSRGQSTFMVEMSELSHILKKATNKSLIILDEIGRGTSTYDGLSIAWSVVEYLSQNKKYMSKTLFATHYHELTELENRIDGVKNFHISINENNDDIIFLRKIIKGRSLKSYGISVAKLAGLPEFIINRSNKILSELQKSDINYNNINSNSDINNQVFDEDNTKFENAPIINKNEMDILNELNNLNINQISPLEAFDILKDILERLK